MTEQKRVLKIVGRDTKPPSKSLRTRDEVVAAYEAVYTELLHLGTMDGDVNERVKALSECRRILADLLNIHDPSEGEKDVDNSRRVEEMLTKLVGGKG